jgi:hypothetical protein
VYKSRNLNINAFIELTSNVSIRFGGKENRENTHTSKGILIVIIDQNFLHENTFIEEIHHFWFD